MILNASEKVLYERPDDVCVSLSVRLFVGYPNRKSVPASSVKRENLVIVGLKARIWLTIILEYAHKFL